MSRRFFTFFVFVLSALLVPTLSMAQDQQPGGGGGGGGGGRQRGGGGGGGGGGNFDPAQFRQRMMDRLKEELSATDDEWKVLEPKVEKVMTAQTAARAGGGGFGGRGRGGGGGGGGGGNFPGADSPAAQAARDLRTTLDNKDASASEITSKLTALRDARSKARAELEAAQKDLKDVLTPRQEAVLVVNGMLE